MRGCRRRAVGGVPRLPAPPAHGRGRDGARAGHQDVPPGHPRSRASHPHRPPPARRPDRRSAGLRRHRRSGRRRAHRPSPARCSTRSSAASSPSSCACTAAMPRVARSSWPRPPSVSPKPASSPTTRRPTTRPGCVDARRLHQPGAIRLEVACSTPTATTARRRRSEKVNDFAADATAQLATLSGVLPDSASGSFNSATQTISKLATQASTLCSACSTTDVQSLVNAVTGLSKTPATKPAHRPRSRCPQARVRRPRPIHAHDDAANQEADPLRADNARRRLRRSRSAPSPIRFSERCSVTTANRVWCPACSTALLNP